MTNDCGEIHRVLMQRMKGNCTINASDFNQKFWNVRYLYEQLWCLAPMIAKLEQCFTDDEFAQVYGNARQKWNKQDPLIAEAFEEGMKSWTGMIHWWFKLLDLAEQSTNKLPPYNEKIDVSTIAESCRNNLEFIEYNTSHYKEYYSATSEKNYLGPKYKNKT